jgi:hypothetical protein
MRSSISASDWPGATRAIWLLAITLFGYLIAGEIAMRKILPRFSETLQRETRDHDAVVRRRPVPAGAKSLLMVGNSLLLDGIDRPRLIRAMAPGHDVAVFPVENTTYLDWYFGLRRLYAEGARPDLVVLCLNATNMLSDATAGEMFAYTLMRSEDLPAVVRASHLDMMTASSYFFANHSALLGTREYLHNGVLSRWLAQADLLARYLPILRPAQAGTGSVVTEEVMERLRGLRESSASFGADFVFLVPPSLNPSDPAEAIRTAANRAGITVLVPYAPGEMPRSAFRDGFHLNADGAARFTERVARALRAPADSSGTLSRLRSASVGRSPGR